MKPIYINTWECWVSLSEIHDFDPYGGHDFSIDCGGGNSINYEFTGNIPKREEQWNYQKSS